MRGWGFGRRHGWGGCGWGRGWGRFYRAPVDVEGYTYIGPCRCGWGPHAFYRDPSGRIVHASEVFGYGYDPKDELEALKREKEELEKRIRELEKQIKEA